jgi:hypothetical protein
LVVQVVEAVEVLALTEQQVLVVVQLELPPQ